MRSSLRDTSLIAISTDLNVRPIALYLPQFHPIPENDTWWGRGFTEWTNTAKAKPLFRGHDQPHVPADLGFYDLRVPETRQAQAVMAREFGIEAFCYYHYWFAGRRVLERPFAEVLESGKPDFPFCLCWANQSWTGIWHGAPGKTLIEQTYPGPVDHQAHFAALLPAFRDHRYVRVDDKPVFVIYRPMEIPNLAGAMAIWRTAAAKAGLAGFYLVGVESDEHRNWIPAEYGFDAVIRSRLPARKGWPTWNRPLEKVAHKLKQWQSRLNGETPSTVYGPTVHAYRDMLDIIVGDPTEGIESYPCIVPNWDNTPRSGVNGLVLHGSTPALFREQVRKAVKVTTALPAERRFVFLKSWNEWAEGNHLEPDLRFGLQYLQVIRDELSALQPVRQGGFAALRMVPAR